MDLAQQIQTLINEAPQDGKTPAAVLAIAPTLKQIAERLQHDQYYILQTLDQSWQLTTLSNRNQPKLEKTVLYAFASLEDAAVNSSADSQLMAIPIFVINLLFQLLALDNVDSIIFFDELGNLYTGIEIQRLELKNQVQAQLQQRSLKHRTDNLPPNIA
jgi:ABC-type transporter Mla subunit MlaD